MSSNLCQFLTSIPWFAWLGIVAIVSGSGTQVVHRFFQHRERMAMIRQGMDPGIDKPEEDDEV
jgi:hypothetical protein